MTKKAKTILIVTAALVAGAAVAVPVAVHQARKPNFAKMTPQQMREFFDPNRGGPIDPNVRQQFAEAMQERMTKQVNDYFALPEEKRTAYLDKIIDDMQTRRAEFLAARQADANGPPDPNRFFRFGPRDPNNRPRGDFRRRGTPPDTERMRARSEFISAQTRVRMIQFRRDLRARMQQRGIQGQMIGPGGPGGFRGPGGFPGPPD